MADFNFTASPLVVSADGNQWIDPNFEVPNPYFDPLAPPGPPFNLNNTPTFTRPSRQNTLAGGPHRYDKFKVNRQIDVLLNPIGTTGLIPDAGLGARRFLAWFVESPPGSFSWSSPPGVSAYQYFFPTALGAYLAAFHRDGGGKILWHFMVEP